MVWVAAVFWFISYLFVLIENWDWKYVEKSRPPLFKGREKFATLYIKSGFWIAAVFLFFFLVGTFGQAFALNCVAVNTHR